jgi:hypothetical protein
MAMMAPRMPQAARTARSRQSVPACRVSGAVSASSNGRTGSPPAIRLSSAELIGRYVPERNSSGNRTSCATAGAASAPETDQAPSASGLPALIAESTAVGSPARLEEDGDPALASPVVGRTAYRIVREALTNVRKHAPGAQVLVRMSYGESQVKVCVRNGPVPGPVNPAARDGLTAAGGDLAATGSGLGIASLRQRIEVVQGTLRAGASPDGGFCLEATMPSYVPTAEPAA